MADLSPELASRVHSLEASYADNPGRYFVALAGAWREGGDIARAEEILRENLKRFPGLSAHVLLGRCLADRGAYQEAANEFHYVLSIDSQNLIALRTLAEMAAAGGRRAEAERWYNELLAVDPMNVEARTALHQMARGASAAPAVESEAAPVPAETGPPADEFGMIDLSAPDASPADTSGAAADEDAVPGEWGDLTLEAPGESEPQPVAAEAGDFDAFGFGSVDLNGDGSPAATDESGWVDVDARQDLGESAEEDAADLPLLDAELAGTSPGDGDLPLLSLDATVEETSFAADVSAPGAGLEFGEPAAFEDTGHVAHERDGHDREAEMVTETMAELYASQGLHAQAADVYRELIRQRGEEPGLVRRLAELEGPEPAESAPDWLEAVDASTRGTAAPALDADVPDLDLSPAQTDEAFATESADEFASFETANEVTVGNAGELTFQSATGASFESADSFASTDSFADSFADGFDGATAGVDPVAEADRQPWEAPAVAETEPVGFDILVVADEDGVEAPAPADVVAEVSADWAIAAAPLEDDEEAAEAALAESASTSSPAPAAAGRTMRGYFDALLAWQPGQVAAAPSQEAADGALTSDIAAAEPASGEVSAAYPPEPQAFPAAPEIPTFEAPSFQPPAPAFGALEPEAPSEETPWAAPAEDEPWAAAMPGESAPEAAAAPAPEELPLLDLEEPWAETPAVEHGEPVDTGAFTLAEDEAPFAGESPATAHAEELLPWEMPAEPAPAPAPAAEAGREGFSFEDFFAGAPAEPTPATAVEPELPAPPAEPATAFIPSTAEPTPPPAFEPPAPPPAAVDQGEEDEDLESFQAWLQSLKR